MKREDQSAIAEYFQGGGEIQRVELPNRVHERDVIDYLTQCGLPVKHFPGEMKPYGCNGKRYSLEKRLRFATEQRKRQRLPPVML